MTPLRLSDFSGDWLSVNDYARWISTPDKPVTADAVRKQVKRGSRMLVRPRTERPLRWSRADCEAVLRSDDRAIEDRIYAAKRKALREEAA